MNDAEKLLKRAQNNSDHVQINVTTTRQDSLIVKNNKIDTFESSNTKLYIVRVWRNNQEGLAYSNKFDLKIVDKAIKNAKANKKIEYFYGLPEPTKYPKPNIYDKKIADISPEEMAKTASTLITDINQNKVNLSQAGISKSVITEEILNSNMVEAQQEYTNLSLYASANVIKSGKISSVWDSIDEVKYFDVGDFGTRLRKKTLSFLNAKRLKKIPKYYIINPEPLSQLLLHAFMDNLNGKNVEKGKSIFKDKLRERVCSTNFSIIDDGRMDKGINTKMFDGEGTPMQKTDLIKYGVLKNFVYDYNTAKHAGKKSTGNMIDSKIGFSNLILKGEQNDVEEAVIIDSVIGAHTSNPITTNFSVSVDRGYYLNNGVIIPIKNHMFSGKMSNVLNDVISIGKGVQQKNGVYSGPLTTSSARLI